MEGEIRRKVAEETVYRDREIVTHTGRDIDKERCKRSEKNLFEWKIQQKGTISRDFSSLVLILSFEGLPYSRKNFRIWPRFAGVIEFKVDPVMCLPPGSELLFSSCYSTAPCDQMLWVFVLFFADPDRGYPKKKFTPHSS